MVKSLGKFGQQPDGTVFSDVMLALSVLLTVGLLFWIAGLWSVMGAFPHYAENSYWPFPSSRPNIYGGFPVYWAGNSAMIDQPLVMFTTVVFLLSIYLFVLVVTNRGTGHRRLLAERTALGAGFVLIVSIAMVTGDIDDIVTGQYTLEKWQGTPLDVPSSLLVTPYRPYPIFDPDAPYWIEIGGEEVLLADADTIRIDNQDYRLWGIDALQKEQICVTKENKPVPCGENAREALLKLMTSVPPSRITCIDHDQARYGHAVSCRAGETDLADWLVRNGHAFPTRAGQYRYGQAEEEAIAKQRGAWGTTFVLPGQWKRVRCQFVLGVCRKYYDAD